MIEMLCPECGHSLRIPDQFAGQRGGCKHCKATFVVPIETPDSSAPSLSTSLEALQADDRRAPVRSEPPEQRLGPAFWVLAVLIPPVALIWAMLLPKGHAQKSTAVVVSLVLLAAGVLVVLPVGIGGVAMKGVREEIAAPVVPSQDAPPDPAVSADDEAAIRGCIERLQAATDHGDLEALRGIVTEDCTLTLMGGARYWELMTPEALDQSARTGTVSKVESVHVITSAGGTAKVKATVSATTRDGWSKTTTDMALRKEQGTWRVAAFEGIEGQSGTGEPSAVTAADKPAQDTLFAYATPYPGVTFEPAAPSTVGDRPVSTGEETVVRVAGITQDPADKVHDYYMKDLASHGWRRVSSSMAMRGGSRTPATTFPRISGVRPGPDGAYKLEIIISIEDCPEGRRILLEMEPTDRGDGSISVRTDSITVNPGGAGAEAMVAPENIGEYVTSYAGVPFGVIDAGPAPRPSFVTSDHATCVAGTTPDPVETVVAFYRSDLASRGWQDIRTHADVMELSGVGWVATDSLSAQWPLAQAGQELRIEITVHAYGQGSGIILCIGPS